MAKRNPQDLALRNLHAQKTVNAELRTRIAALRARVAALERAVSALAFAAKRRQGRVR